MGELCSWRSGQVRGHEVNAQRCTSNETNDHSYWLIGGVIEEGLLDTSRTLSKLKVVYTCYKGLRKFIERIRMRKVSPLILPINIYPVTELVNI